MNSRNLGSWTTGIFLGEGSTGRVFVARSAERQGAVKLLPPPRSLNPAQIQAAWPGIDSRLAAIAEVAGSNVVSIWDWGREDDEALIWIVMERLKGRTLDGAGPLDPADVIAHARDAATGLCAAHARGVSHGDLKPANLFRLDDGRVVLIDFALPFHVDDEDAASGSPMWLPPECLEGGPLTPAADVYALGQCLAELLSGQPAFILTERGPGRLVELLAQKSSCRALDPGHNAGTLRTLIQACTAHSAHSRPTAEELVSLLA